tara:strand:+ start:198 stop:1493 length:1296 start_codon:yes stop_codon:yes gene_type:complete
MVAPLALFLGSALGMGLAGRAKAKKQRGLLNRELKTLSDVLDLQPETRTRSITLPSFEEDLSLDEVKDPMQIDGMNVGGGILQPKPQPTLLKRPTITSSFDIENPLIREARENPRTLGILREAKDLETRKQLGLIEPPSTTQIKNYNTYASQTIAAGNKPMPFIDFLDRNEKTNQSGSNTVQSLWTTGKGENQKVFREIYENGQRFFDGPTGRLTFDQVIETYGDILPTTAGNFGPGKSRFTSQPQFARDVTAISDIDISLTNLEKYFGGVQDTNTGLKRLGDQITAAIKTLSGNKDYTNKEVLLGISNSRLQREIGSNRLAIVGGGVMTEKDAWRVVQGLGGDINALQNPEVLRQALRDMYEVNLRKRDNLIPLYNIGIEDLGYERDYRRKRKTGKFNEQTQRYTYNHILDNIFGEEYQEIEDITDEFDD